jgi:hypothetical protein
MRPAPQRIESELSDYEVANQALRLVSSLKTAGGFFTAAAVAFDFVRDFLVFVQRTERGSLDGRGVDEDVLAAIIGLDETIALSGVIPFDSAGSHLQDSPFE